MQYVVFILFCEASEDCCVCFFKNLICGEIKFRKIVPLYCFVRPGKFFENPTTPRKILNLPSYSSTQRRPIGKICESWFTRASLILHFLPIQGTPPVIDHPNSWIKLNFFLKLWQSSRTYVVKLAGKFRRNTKTNSESLDYIYLLFPCCGSKDFRCDSEDNKTFCYAWKTQAKRLVWDLLWKTLLKCNGKN